MNGRGFLQTAFGQLKSAITRYVRRDPGSTCDATLCTTHSLCCCTATEHWHIVRGRPRHVRAHPRADPRTLATMLLSSSSFFMSSSFKCTPTYVLCSLPRTALHGRSLHSLTHNSFCSYYKLTSMGCSSREVSSSPKFFLLFKNSDGGLLFLAVGLSMRLLPPATSTPDIVTYKH